MRKTEDRDTRLAIGNFITWMLSATLDKSIPYHYNIMDVEVWRKETFLSCICNIRSVHRRSNRVFFHNELLYLLFEFAYLFGLLLCRG